MNFVPLRYRGVAVATVPRSVPLSADGLRGHLLGRDAYRRTRFVVVRRDPDVPGPTAVVRIGRAREGDLFAPITTVELLAGPDECAYVVAPEVDTGIPSALAAVAREQAPGARAVVVQGRYAHVSFIIEPRPLRVVVRDVVPPTPAKLVDQARRVLALAEDLRPIEIVADTVELAELAARTPAAHYLLPCRGSGVTLPTVSYLDEHPARADWTLLGCARSRQIHRHFYGDDPPTVDICPKSRHPTEGAVLTKCCLQEEHIEEGPGWVSVPWGSSLRLVGDALHRLADREEPPWRPA